MAKRLDYPALGGWRTAPLVRQGFGKMLGTGNATTSCATTDEAYYERTG
jgi:hypothetical protein